MQVFKKINIDLSEKSIPQTIYVMQNDINSRIIEISLFSNSAPWVVPENATPSIAFKNQKDNHKGWYDELPDGSKAISATGNVVVLTLAQSVVSSHGDVSIAIVFQDEKLNQLATFPFLVSVEPNPAFGENIVNDYYKYSTMEAVSEAIDFALSELETSKTENSPAIICELSGEIITISDASDRQLQGLTLYGKTTQDGTPTPKNPIELVSVGSGSITVSISNGTDENTQSIVAPISNDMRGIPVSSGGNYTDENGQQWVCDEVDFERGTYIQRVRSITLDSTMAWYQHNIVGTRHCYYCEINNSVKSFKTSLCSHFLNYSYAWDYATLGIYSDNDEVRRKYFNTDLASIAEWTSWLDEQKALGAPVELVYTLATPVETPLSAEELAQYAALHTNKPNTTIFNDSGAGMKVEYIADTKAYIDNKFTELQNAILATSANI